MTRKELEAVCKVLKAGRVQGKVYIDNSYEQDAVCETLAYVGVNLCDVFHLTLEQRDKFLKAAGIEVIPPR